MQMGMETDIDSAMRRCASDSPSILASARTSADANIAAQAPFVGNFTWRALKSIDTLDDPARELVMSIVGAVIFPAETANRDPEYVGPSITTVAQLLYGQSDAAGGNINLQLLRCNNYTDCDAITRDNAYVHQPLTKKVSDIMQAISDNIRTRTAIPNNSAAVGFVNSTSIPVWRMLSIGNTIPGSGLADMMIGNYREVIAADYAFTFLNQFANVAISALTKQHRLSERQRSLANQQREDVQKFMALLQQEQATLYRKVTAVSTVATDMERLERNLRSSMSLHALDMLGYSSRGSK
jgi:conjugative transfer pilus assembly protein TraH